MIISENREKVKKKALMLINKKCVKFSKPEKKFMLEMMLGMVMSGSSNLSEIARHLKESTPLKHILKRLSRNLLHDHILEASNEICLEAASTKIERNTILALDIGDITHPYGDKFELIESVHDGSSDKLEKGYWLNQVSGYNPSSHETFPVQLDIYSTSEKGFKSANSESLSLVNKVIDRVGFDGLWVMDRDYDSGIILDSFLNRGLDFAIRMKCTRNLIVDDKAMNIKEAGETINRRTRYNSVSRFGSMKATLRVNRQDYKVTLISFKDKRNKELLLLLCNGWIKSTKELKRRIRGYFRRWGVEESYRFEKQGFEIEKCTLRKFSRIKTMIGLTMLSWLLLVKINESPKLREVVLKKAKMEKDKQKHLPKFIYYRLLKGVRNLFAGVNELFRFRWKKDRKRLYKEELKKQRPLFPDNPFEFDWMEVVI